MAIAVEEFIQQIDGMSVLELNNLVKALEDHYGVSAAAAAVVAALVYIRNGTRYIEEYERTHGPHAGT